MTASGVSSRTRRLRYAVLVGVIALTIPCYLVGFGALLILQQPSAQPTPAARMLTPVMTLGAPLVHTATPPASSLFVPTATPLPTPTPLVPVLPTFPPVTPTEIAPSTATPLPLPTETRPPTPTLVPIITPTLDFATATPEPTPTSALTPELPPTALP
ncbi:MAG: hypothetical protein RMJ86_08690 [Anaerolineae bacterium]|nr:hypothetical protein [Thermoflexales bacterium]MDW8054608.1 hypothetical protein [Anaerolineae bacterium]